MALKDGARRLLHDDSRNIEYSFSPPGKYLICYNGNDGVYFSYDLITVSLDIFSGIPTPLGNDNWEGFLSIHPKHPCRDRPAG